MGQHVQSSIKLNENTSVEPMACCLDNVKPLPSAPRASANSNHWPRTLQHLNSGTRGTRRLMALSSAVLRKYAHLLGAIPKEAFVFNRHTVATAALIGLFIGMLPIPMQMLVAAAAALMFRAYLPVAVCAVWVSNPFTYIPLLWAAYVTGNFILATSNLIKVAHTVPLTLAELSTHPLGILAEIWLPVLVGSISIGAVLGVVGFLGIHAVWHSRLFKRWHH